MSKITNLWGKKDTPKSIQIAISYCMLAVDRSKDYNIQVKHDINNSLSELLFELLHIEKISSIEDELLSWTDIPDLKKYFVHLSKTELIISKEWIRAAGKGDYEPIVLDTLKKLKSVIIYRIFKTEKEDRKSKREMIDSTP